MNRPSDRALCAWWTSLPDGPYKCSDCDRTDSKAYVQPQHPYYASGLEGTALCAECIGRRNERAHEARRAQLAAAPRCEVPRCHRRAAYTHNGVGICGAHVTQAQAELRRRTAASGFPGAMFLPPPMLERAALVELATARRDGALVAP